MGAPAPRPRRRATIDVFGLVALAIFGLIAAVLLIRFTGLAGGAMGETHAARNINELVAGAKLACRDGDAVVSAFTVPEQYAYVLRTCDLWDCPDGRCEDEAIPGPGWPLDKKTKEKVSKKFCSSSSKNLLVACHITYEVKHDWWVVGMALGWKHIAADKIKCEPLHCGISYDVNLLMPGKKKYRVDFAKDGDAIIGRRYDA